MSLELRELKQTLPQIGTIRWIGLRPGRREPMNVVTQAVIRDDGLEGDRFSGSAGAPRTITLIQHEHIASVASMLDRDEVDPELLRRNIVVSGINLLALKDNHFCVGDVVLFATGNCPPCSRMEENLGPGGFNAMRGHGGITARVVQPGTIHVGDQVRWLGENAEGSTSEI